MGCLTGIARRHEQLVAETTLRGMRYLSSWAHVSRSATAMDRRAARRGPADLLRTIQGLAVADRESVLTSSTTLSELAVFPRTA
jgi:hypothetical protein